MREPRNNNNEERYTALKERTMHTYKLKKLLKAMKNKKSLRLGDILIELKCSHLATLEVLTQMLNDCMKGMKS